MGKPIKLQCDFEAKQKKTCCGFLFFFLVFYALTVENVPGFWAKIAWVCYSLGVVQVVVCAGYCCVVVPEDVGTGTDSGKLCPKCNKSVTATCVHCDICRICVPGYSHHSYYLKNCIGSRNIFAYLSLLSGLLVSSAIQTICGVWVATVILLADDRGRALAEVRNRQKYSLMDNGCSFKLTILFATATSFTVTLSAFSSLLVHAYAYCTRKKPKIHPEVASDSRKSELIADISSKKDSYNCVWKGDLINNDSKALSFSVECSPEIAVISDLSNADPKLA